jgi:hypothetical protein
MKISLKHLFLAGTIAGAAQIARAVPTLMITDGTNSVTIADGSSLDSNSAAGAVSWNGSLDNWTLNFDTGLGYPAIGSPTSPILDLSFGAYTSTGGALWVYFSEDGFTAGGSTLANIGGTTQGQVAFGTFGGTSNTLFDHSASNLLTILPFTNGSYTGPVFSGTESGGTVGGGAPYSLTEIIAINQVGAGLTTGDASLTVPDGGTTALLLGVGLLGLGVVASKRKLGSIRI